MGVSTVVPIVSHYCKYKIAPPIVVLHFFVLLGIESELSVLKKQKNPHSRANFLLDVEKMGVEPTTS